MFFGTRYFGPHYWAPRYFGTESSDVGETGTSRRVIVVDFNSRTITVDNPPRTVEL